MDRARIYIEPLNIRARIVKPQPGGLPVINLGFNELPWPATRTVQEAINRSASKANVYGNPSCQLLRAAIAGRWGLNQEQVICGNGSEELLDVIGRVFARSHDEILISEFGYIQFPIVSNRVGATLVKAPETDYTTNVDAMLENVTDKTTLVFLANPNNPTGTMIDESELRRLLSSLPSTTVLVIDLAYGEFAGDNYCDAMHRLVSEFDNVIITRTFSKAYGLAGLRIGWLYAPQWMIPALYAARGMGTVNAVAQAAAVAAIEDFESMCSRVKIIVEERERVQQRLSSMGVVVVASSANFVMAALDRADTDCAETDCSETDRGDIDRDHVLRDAESSADALTAHLYDDAGILVNQTREAGLEKFIRFSISIPEVNDRLLSSIAEFVQR